MSKNFLMFGAAAVAMTAYAAPALAQDGEEEAEARQNVITVTARKSEENIQDIPISVSAITGDAINEQGILGISQLSDFIPGFQQQQAFGRDGDRPVIRGTSNILISEGKVGIFIDGIPFLGDSSSLDLSTLERVEVIKGPQSAVFGRGTLSGAINYVTRTPGDAPIEGRISAEFGEHEHHQATGFANFRVNDQLAFSLSGKFYDFGGDYDNELGGKLNERQTTTYSAAAFFDPTDDISIQARYIYSKDDDGHYAIALTDTADNNCFLDTRGYICGEVPVPDSYAINTDSILEPGLYRETDRGFLTVDWDVMGSGYSLTYQAGITDIYERTGTDSTFDENQAFFIGGSCVFFITNCDPNASAFNDTGAIRRTGFTNELRLSSPQDMPFRWRLGAFTSSDDRKGLAEYIEFTEFGPDSLGDRVEVDNVAFFGGAEYDVNDRLTIGGEIRYAEDDIMRAEQQYVLSQYVDPSVTNALPLPFFNPAQPNQIVGGDSVREASFDSFTPRITVDYRVNEDLLVYGQFAEGNSPGGFNATDAPQTTFDEETLTNFEVGAKTSKFGFDRLNVSGFFNIYDNQVLTNTYTTAQGGTNSFSTNVGETEIFGLEIEFARYITDDLLVYGSYGYLDAEITEGADDDQAILLGGADCDGATGEDFAGPAECVGLASIVGQTPPLVSDHQLALGARYDFKVGEAAPDFYVGGDLTYRSSFYAQVHNEAETGDATQVNFRAGFDLGDINFQIWGKNIFEDDTPVGILRYVDFNAPDSPAGSTRAFGLTPPAARQIGATATFSF
ncbi:MAG: TonB-dependent receptor [Henriciella sp.]|nr:TonB-dependent receptor [Henriciella sp.]